MAKQAVFYGPYDASMDSKKRVLLPMPLRRCIEHSRDGSTLFAITGPNKKVWLFTERGYLDQAEGSVNLMPDQNEVAYNHLMYGTARNIDFDAQGRIRIPDSLLDRTGTKSAVTFVGSKDHIEVWNTEDWLAREDELETLREKILAARAKQSPPPNMNQPPS